jgi:hypothetical protein
MSAVVQGSVVLAKGFGSSRKEFHIELRRPESSGEDGPRRVYTWSGKNAANAKLPKDDPDDFMFDWIEDKIKTKISEGYGIELVNGKPFPSGNLDDAVKLMEDCKTWESTATAQPNQRIRPRNVTVTFDVGQCAPVW